MIKNILKFTLGFAFLSLVPSAYPMAAVNPATKRIAMEYLKKGIEKGKTALHWGIAAGPCWVYAGVAPLPYLLPEVSMPLKKTLSDRDFESWIKNELSNQGMKETETLVFNPVFEEMNFAGYSFFDKKMFTYSWTNLLYSQLAIMQEKYQKKCSFDDLYSTILNTNSERDNTLKYLEPNELRAILSHEKIHIEKKHAQKYFALGIMTPLITHFLGKKIVAKPVGFIKNMISVITKFGVNSSIFWYAVHSGEKEADEGVVNNLEILDGGASLFYHLAGIEARNPKNLLSSIVHFVDPHPDSLKRAQRFEERANELRVVEPTDRQKNMHEVHRAQLRAALQKL
ncbi:hypothetical protein BH09DEP1_BH09DEP1_3840 [soil metagenome]